MSNDMTQPQPNPEEMRHAANLLIPHISYTGKDDDGGVAKVVAWLRNVADMDDDILNGRTGGE